MFASCLCDLAEGIYFDKESEFVFWVDINQSRIYRKSIRSSISEFEYFALTTLPSTILSVDGAVILFTDRNGISSFNMDSGYYEVSSPVIYNDDESNFRLNDAVILKDGRILYGSMRIDPYKGRGKLFYSHSLKTIEIQDADFAIPNTFLELCDGILVSDSLVKKTYLVSTDIHNNLSKQLWRDFSSFKYTPDGGCIDKSGNIYLSMWDGFCIGVFDISAKQIKNIKLPVPRPTNCVLVDDRWLYVSSAREGLTKDELVLYPQSGNILVIDLDI